MQVWSTEETPMIPALAGQDMPLGAMEATLGRIDEVLMDEMDEEDIMRLFAGDTGTQESVIAAILP